MKTSRRVQVLNTTIGSILGMVLMAGQAMGAPDSFTAAEFADAAKAYCRCALQHKAGSKDYKACRKERAKEYNTLNRKAPGPGWSAGDKSVYGVAVGQFLECMFSPREYAEDADGNQLATEPPQRVAELLPFQKEAGMKAPQQLAVAPAPEAKPKPKPKPKPIPKSEPKPKPEPEPKPEPVAVVAAMAQPEPVAPKVEAAPIAPPPAPALVKKAPVPEVTMLEPAGSETGAPPEEPVPVARVEKAAPKRAIPEPMERVAKARAEKPAPVVVTEEPAMARATPEPMEPEAEAMPEEPASAPAMVAEESVPEMAMSEPAVGAEDAPPEMSPGLPDPEMADETVPEPVMEAEAPAPVPMDEPMEADHGTLIAAVRKPVPVIREAPVFEAPRAEPEPVAAPVQVAAARPTAPAMSLLGPLPYAWQVFQGREAGLHLGQLVRVTDQHGAVHKGGLAKVTDSTLELRMVKMDGGGSMKINRSRILELAVFERVR